MVTRANVTQREFEQEFSSVEDCLAAAFEHGQALIARAMLGAIEGERDWLTRSRLGLVSVLEFLDSAPGWARLLVIEAPARSAAARARRKHAMERLAELLERGSPEAHEGLALQRGLTAELVIGGVFSVINARMLKHENLPLIDLAPSLMSLIVLPYLGSEAANKELAYRPHAISAKEQLGGERPVRTTYRTALVLRAIEGSPHSNNREIAVAAGLGDEGQASRLLSRLRRQGLIENVGLGQAYGEPNAWLLTAEGKRVSALIGTELSPKAWRAAKSTRASAKARGAGRAQCQN